MPRRSWRCCWPFFAFLAGALASLLFSFITITLRANQNVTGLALTIFGTGAGQFLGEYMRVQEGSYVSLSNNLKAIFVNSPSPPSCATFPCSARCCSSTTS